MRKSDEFSSSVSFKKLSHILQPSPSVENIRTDPSNCLEEYFPHGQNKNNYQNQKMRGQFRSECFVSQPQLGSKKILSEGSVSQQSVNNPIHFQGRFAMTSDSEKSIRKGGGSSSGGDQKYLFINNKKQKSNNNYLFTTDIEVLQKDIKDYQVSVEKLKEENLRLRSQKILFNTRQEELIVSQLKKQIQIVQKRIKRLQITQRISQTDLRLLNLDENDGNISYGSIRMEGGQHQKRNSQQLERFNGYFIEHPNQQNRIKYGFSNVNSPKSVVSSPFENLQSVKSPYFLKKFP